jgi:hypothetical protein
MQEMLGVFSPYGRMALLALCLLSTLCFAPRTLAQAAPPPTPVEVAPVAPALAEAAVAGPASVELQLAQLRAELASLTRTVDAFVQADALRRNHEAWAAAREARARAVRVGPSVGFLVGGSAVLATGLTLAFNDDLRSVGAAIAAAGGLLVFTGVFTLTRALRKRRAIRQEILRAPHAY